MTATANARGPGGLLTGHPGAVEQVAAGSDGRATLWAESLQQLALALVRAMSLDDVAAAVVAYGTLAAGGACGHVLLLDQRGDVGVSLLGGPAVPSRRLDGLALDAATPWNDAVRKGHGVAFSSSGELYRSYPALEPLLPLPTSGPVVTTPLVIVGEICGAVTFGFADPAPGDGDPVVNAPFGEIAALTAHATARAALHAGQDQSAELLQRAYLPASLSPLAGLTFATRYLPAGEPMVGGDWYDVVPLPGSEQVAIIIGDVAGHGLRSATVMASLRAALRAFATVDSCPSGMLARLNDYTCLFKPEAFATVFVAVFDPAVGGFRYARAGHPPALLVDRVGPAAVLDQGLGPPLGVPGARYELSEQAFPPGASLVAYTDGLIERRDQPIDARLADLVAACDGVSAGPDNLCDRLVFELLAGKDLSDDAALLVATRGQPGT